MLPFDELKKNPLFHRQAELHTQNTPKVAPKITPKVPPKITTKAAPTNINPVQENIPTHLKMPSEPSVMESKKFKKEKRPKEYSERLNKYVERSTVNNIFTRAVSTVQNVIADSREGMILPHIRASARTQEHILYRGSNVQLHTHEFRRQVAKRQGPGFDKLSRELKTLKPINIHVYNLFYPFIEDYKKITKSWIKDSRHALVKAKVGDSVWIDGATHAGRHGMMMRFTKTSQNTFSLQFANTGSGLENSDFHPKGENINYQTVAVIDNIPATKLIKGDFFKTYSAIANRGKLPKSSSLYKEISNFNKSRTKSSREENAIGLLYDTVKLQKIAPSGSY